jgi:hypothetical protein
MPGPRALPRALLLSLSLAAVAPSAAAFPGVLVSKDGAKRHVQASHIVMMHRANTSVVTVMPDYVGPGGTFLVILPVPGDRHPRSRSGSSSANTWRASRR